MSSSTYFYQECPTCGRPVEIRVEYLGRKVTCHHCRGKLVARDASSFRPNPAHKSSTLLERAEQLLDSLAEDEKEELHPTHTDAPNPR